MPEIKRTELIIILLMFVVYGFLISKSLIIMGLI